MSVIFADFGTALLSAPFSADSTVLSVFDASRLPVLSGTDYFYLVLQAYSDKSYVEVVKCVSISGGNLTVERGSVRKAFSVGDYVENRLTFDGLRDAVYQWPSVQSIEALRRSYAEAGFTVKGPFVVGAQVTSANDVLIDEVTGVGYAFTGTYPHTVASWENPASAGWTDRSSTALRFDLSDPGKGDSLLAVKQPFVGSTPRKQRDKNKEIISLKDFAGVVGDGVNDDTLGVQAALNTGGFIIVPPGRYKITSSLRIHSDTCLFGMGVAILSYENPSTDWRDAIMLINGPLKGVANNGGYSNTKNIRLIGIEFDGTPRASLGQMTEHIAFAHHMNLLIESCVFRNYAGNTHSIELNSTKNAVVRNCMFVGWVRQGATAGSREFINIDSSTEAGFPTFGPWDGTVCDNISVYWNEFDGGDVAVGSHSSAMPAPHTNIRVSGNTIRNVVSYGVSAYFWKDSEVSDNHIKGAARGIRFAACVSCSMNRNKLHNCSNIGLQVGYKDPGLGSRDIIIEGNSLSNCGGSPIDGATDVKVLNNTYLDVAAVGTNVWSISDTASVTCKGNAFPVDGSMVGKNPYGQAYFTGRGLRIVDDTTVFSLLKDTVARIPVTSIGGQGLVWIYALASTATNRPRGLYFYRANSVDSLILTPVVDVASGVTTTTGDLTGTSGTDGVVTLSVINGYIVIENRFGTSNFSVQFI